MRTIVLLIAAIIIFFLIRYLQRLPHKVLLQFAAVAGGICLILLAATGRLHWVAAAIGALLPFLRRLLSLIIYLPLLQRFTSRYKTGPTTANPSPGRTSDVESRYLRMSLNHDTGEVDGVILEGQNRGKRLGELEQEELLALFNELLSQDQESADLMQAYLDRIYGEAWYEWADTQRDNAHQAATSSGDLSQEEALGILGLKPGADEHEIISAHRRLMQKLHPDRGGSDYLASKINKAKDALLG